MSADAGQILTRHAPVDTVESDTKYVIFSVVLEPQDKVTETKIVA